MTTAIHDEKEGQDKSDANSESTRKTKISTIDHNQSKVSRSGSAAQKRTQNKKRQRSEMPAQNRSIGAGKWKSPRKKRYGAVHPLPRESEKRDLLGRTIAATFGSKETELPVQWRTTN